MSDDNTQEPQVQTVGIQMPGSDNVVQVSPEVKELINKMQGVARKDATKKAEAQFQPIKDLVEELKGSNNGLSEKLAALEESQMDEGERLKSQYTRNLKTLQDDNESLKAANLSLTEKYNNTMITNDTFAAFGDYKLVNNSQVSILFKNDCQARIEEKIDAQGNGTGEFETRMKMIVSDGNGGYQEQDGTPKELFKLWIEQESNKHLLINALNPGSGSSVSGNSSNASDYDKLCEQYDQAMKDGKIQLAISLKPQIAAAKPV